MLKLQDLQEFGGYSETNREKFIPNEIANNYNCYIEERVNKDNGETFLVLVMMNTKTNKKQSHYLSKKSALSAGDKVDPKSIECIELSNGEDIIYRLDGEEA